MNKNAENPSGPPSRPGALLIGELDVHDEAGMAAYGERAIPLLKQWGGEILAIVPPGADTVEGESTSRTLIIHSWPSVERFDAFYNSPEYQPIKPLRLQSASARLTAVRTLPPGWLPRALR